MAYQLILGSHVSLKAPDYLVGALTETLANNANALMIYTGAPQNTIRTDIKYFKLEAYFELAAKANFNLQNTVVHAPYTMNLADNSELEKYTFAKQFLLNECQRAVAIHVPIIVIHPGNHLNKQSILAATQNCANIINYVLEQIPTIKIAIETMSGKGTEIGCDFMQIKQILDFIQPNLKNRVGVCWDTCHLNDAGYDLKNDLESIIDQFNTVVGLDKILVMHINDSQFPLSSHKDRHANIGYGHLGFDILTKIVHHPKFDGVIKILETPYRNGLSPYRTEIEMLTTKTFLKLD